MKEFVDSLRREISQIERLRGHRLLVLVLGTADGGGKTVGEPDVPVVHECIRRLGQVPRLDVLLCVEGGHVHAARRIVKLLRATARALTILVPAKLYSAGTIMALGAEDLILGPLGELGPIDPSVVQERTSASNLPVQVAAEEIRTFRLMAKDWFGLSDLASRTRALELLCEKIFPPALAKFYRAERYVAEVAQDLLTDAQPRASRRTRMRIVKSLMHDHSFHRHGLLVPDLKKLGLRASPADDVLTEHMAGIMALVARHRKDGVQTTPEARSEIDGIMATSDTFAQHVRTWPTSRGPGAAGPTGEWKMFSP